MPSPSVHRSSRRLALAWLSAALGLTGAFAHGQAHAPLEQSVRWSWQLLPGPAGEAELVVTAELAPDWVVYSSDFKADVGPQPVRLALAPGNGSSLLGPLRSIDAKRKHDRAFDAELGYFSQRVELRQRVRLPPDGGPLVAVLRGQACYEADGTCHLIRQDIRIASR
jgi:hypothetical protein